MPKSTPEERLKEERRKSKVLKEIIKMHGETIQNLKEDWDSLVLERDSLKNNNKMLKDSENNLKNEIKDLKEELDYSRRMFEKALDRIPE